MKRIKRFLYRIFEFFKFTPFKVILFFSIVFISPKVFAQEWNITNKIKATTNYTSGSYYAVAPAVVPVPLFQNVNTRYNGTLSQIEFYVNVNDFNWDYNKTYTMTLTMETDDWRNHFMGPQVFRANSDGSIPSSASNMYVSSSFKFISMKKIKFNFKIPSSMGPYIKFRIYSTNTANTAFTGVSNYKLNGVYISNNVSSTPTPAPITPTPTPTPQPNNQDIINNAQQNTQDIINNSNQNTQDIIDSNSTNTSDIIENNNSNTQQIIDSNNSNFNDCFQSFSNNILQSGKGYNLSGQLVSRSGSLYSKIYKIEPGSTISIIDGASGTTNVFILWDENMNFIDYYYMRTRELVVPSNVRYFAFSKTDSGIGVSNNKGFCTSKIDNVSQSINDLNDTMKNDDIDDKTGFFTGFENNDHGLTSIITLPLSTIQQLTNTSCVSLSIPIPFTDSNVSLPCMTEVYQTYIPSVYNIWQVVSFGIISYFICLDIFKIVKGLKDPNEDKVEVLDL